MGFDPISFLLGSKAGGGGGQPASSPWTKIAEQDFTVSTTSTGVTEVGKIECGNAVLTSGKIIFARVRDKAGKRNGYYFGEDCYFLKATSSSVRYCYSVNDSGTVTVSTSSYGILLSSINYQGKASFSVTYNSTNTRTIDGTYHVEVYTLEWPDNVSPFA